MYCDNEKKEIKKLAVMGGTFDPIHYGHLVAAEAVRYEYNIDNVIFIPTGNPPHKKSESITDSYHRYLMTVLATVSNSHFDVSSIEIERKGKTYTIDTIKALKKKYGQDAEIFFITGADAVLEIMTWHKVEELMTLCKFVAVTRPGYNNNELEQRIYELTSKYRAQMFQIEIPLLAISSTDIRNRIKYKKTIKYLVPETIEKYITKNRLYLE